MQLDAPERKMMLVKFRTQLKMCSEKDIIFMSFSVRFRFWLRGVAIGISVMKPSG